MLISPVSRPLLPELTALFLPFSPLRAAPAPTQIVPAAFGICVEIAYAPERVRQRHSLRHQPDLNEVVNSVLRTVYDSSALEGQKGRRPVVFTSFAPDVCAALNWKQPNCTLYSCHSVAVSSFFPLFLPLPFSPCPHPTTSLPSPFPPPPPPTATAPSSHSSHFARMSHVHPSLLVACPHG